MFEALTYSEGEREGISQDFLTGLLLLAWLLNGGGVTGLSASTVMLYIVVYL